MSSSALAPGLYVVGTPIGNLEDITLRALRVLREADVIACEDTRHTQKLLNHFEIRTPTESYHQHNEASRAQELATRISQGARVALVSDAGMPGISDPGERLIDAVIQLGLPVIAVPGPSALISALVASGMPTTSFRFLGFLPPRSGERRTRLEKLRSEPDTLIFYEAPHRILDMLADVQATFGGARAVVIARELTKVHEEFLRGTVAEVLEQLRAREGIKGEMTVIVAGATETATISENVIRPADRLRELMADAAADEKSVLKQVAREFELSRSEVYREWQRVKDTLPGNRNRGKKD